MNSSTRISQNGIGTCACLFKIVKKAIIKSATFLNSVYKLD